MWGNLELSFYLWFLIFHGQKYKSSLHDLFSVFEHDFPRIYLWQRPPDCFFFLTHIDFAPKIFNMMAFIPLNSILRWIWSKLVKSKHIPWIESIVIVTTVHNHTSETLIETKLTTFSKKKHHSVWSLVSLNGFERSECLSMNLGHLLLSFWEISGSDGIIPNSQCPEVCFES